MGVISRADPGAEKQTEEGKINRRQQQKGALDMISTSFMDIADSV